MPFKPPARRGSQIEDALCRSHDSKSRARCRQQATDKRGRKKDWSEPPEHSMREESKRQKTFAWIEIFGMTKEGLIVAGSDTHPPRKLCRPGWGDFLDCNCLRIIDDSIALKANLERDLKIFDD